MNTFTIVIFVATLASVCLAQQGGYGRPGYGGYRQSGYGYNRRPGYGHGGSGYGYRYKSCPKLSDPKFGDVKITSLRPGGKAIHKCDKGYVLDGNRVRICQKNGDWTGEPPTCKPIDCGAPPKADINGAVSYTGTTLGDKAIYTCDDGYELSTGGNEFEIECLPSGDWSDEAPDCDPVDCGSPPDPDENGGVYVGPTTFKSTAIYFCKDGYILDFSNGGSKWIYCQSNGEWSGTAPDCAPIDCGYLAAPKNGAVKFVPDTTLRSRAKFSCDYGFKLVGSDVLTCEASGDWSDTPPTCERIKYGYGHNDGYGNKKHDDDDDGYGRPHDKDYYRYD